MTEVPTPRPASTVAILRDGAAGIDVWLMRRAPAMNFAAGMRAFPGGSVESVDDDATLPWTGRAADGFASAFHVKPDFARALVSAAVRETFEESGVLFVAGALRDADALEAARVALLDGTLAWNDLLRDHGLALDADALVPWARWITPTWAPRRFDAFFFLARVAADTEPRHIEGEADLAEWVPVAEAVAAYEDGRMPMLPPTITVLRQVAAHASVDEALAGYPRTVTEEDG